MKQVRANQETAKPRELLTLMCALRFEELDELLCFGKRYVQFSKNALVLCNKALTKILSLGPRVCCTPIMLVALPAAGDPVAEAGSDDDIGSPRITIFISGVRGWK